jgi:hypothetical protein
LQEEQEGDVELSVMTQSIFEMEQYIEDCAHLRLVKQLKEQIRLFETPLENTPEFLTFLKVTMKILRDKNKEYYAYMFNELVAARSRYIELNFRENVNLIFSAKKKAAVEQNVAKRVAHLLAWLHQALVNEIFVLENTNLDNERYCEVLDRIFDKRLANALKSKVEQEIKGQQEGEFT